MLKRARGRVERLNQRGASILEVVIMSGVMVAMMTGFMSLIGHETKNVTYLEDKLSRVALESELRLQFTNSGAGDFCKNLLVGVKAPLKGQSADITGALTNSSQKIALGKIFQSRGNKTVYDQLEIGKISLEESDLSAPGSSGTVNLAFYPSRIRKGGGPPALQPIKIKTTVSVDGSYKIQSCNTEDEDGPSCKLDNRQIQAVQRSGGCFIRNPSTQSCSVYATSDYKVPSGTSYTEITGVTHGKGRGESAGITTYYLCVTGKWFSFWKQN